MTLLAIDIGTTHLKAGLFTPDGRALHIASRPNAVLPGWKGIASHDPQQLWESIQSLLVELSDRSARQPARVEPVQAIGVASMAETGLLVGAASGEVRTPLIPWFETAALSQTEAYRRQADLEQVFLRTGLHPTFKYSLMKLLWLKRHAPDLLPGSVWLSAADYVVARLGGARVTDYTLAQRTCAFRIDKKEWDSETLLAVGLPAALFPPARRSGEPAGGVLPEHAALGLPAGIPVSVCGHDHIVGAFAAHAVGKSAGAAVFDSMGTAEVLFGMFPERRLTQADYESGFAFGLACAPGYLYWLGGLSTSGGSVEWLRGILDEPALSYADLEALIAGRANAPTGILYFPYLAGSGSPHSDSLARGAFLGLSSRHARPDIYRAVLEGCAYEMEYHRRIAEQVTASPLVHVIAAGGGTRNPAWMQIKADVYGCKIDVLEQEETSLLGAALLAGIGAGVIAPDAPTSLSGLKTHRYTPDPERSREYRRLFENGFAQYEPVIRKIRF